MAKKLVKERDLIIHGHHPHVIQGVQRYNNSIISYSLGNFVFDDCVSKNGKFVLNQNKQNKESFILEVEMDNGYIIGTSYIGFRETNYAFEFFDIEKEIEKITTELDQIYLTNEYENLRSIQINSVREEKFSKRNLKWLMSRLNYYSIGAKITNDFRRRRYNKVSNEFK